MSGVFNWNYLHREHAWPVVNVMRMDDVTLNDHLLLKQKLDELADVEFHNHLRGGTVTLHNSSDCGWIRVMRDMGYRYAVIWWQGTWPDDHDYNYTLLEEIDRFNREDPNWIVAGDFRFKRLNDSIQIINLNNYIEERAPNLYRDPDAQEATTDHVTCEYTQTVIDYINSDEERSVPVISENVLDHLIYFDPHQDPERLTLSLSGEDDWAPNFQSARVLGRLKQPSSPIYFVNTERNNPEILEQQQGFKQFIGPTAGFKLYWYASQMGFDENCTFIHYDFDPLSVDFKRDTVEMWDGEDYPAWCREWCSWFPEANTKLLDQVDREWPRVIESFGGYSQWQATWKRIKKCEHIYVNCDLINQYQDIFQHAHKTKTFLWTSNIYSYIIPKLLSKPLQLEASFIGLVNNLVTLNNESWFHGTDPNDNDINCPARVINSATKNQGLNL